MAHTGIDSGGENFRNGRQAYLTGISRQPSHFAANFYGFFGNKSSEIGQVV
jgi:hypothetical protein